MIEIGRHIEILLLDNDCVIVPEFGGFVAHHVSARYDDKDDAWIPPMRTLGFNPQLHINDSLLVQSYVNAYDISYPEALRRVEDEVEELKQELANEGSYSIDDIGTLTVNAEGNYQFEPCEAGILSPALYGLGCCEFMTLKDSREVRETESAQKPLPFSATQETATPSLLDFTDETDEASETEEQTIRIKMSWVRNTIAVAAAVIAFFVMATPIANSDLRTRTMGHMQNKLFYKLIPQDTNISPVVPVADTLSAKHTVAKTTTDPADKVTPANTSKPYCIVLASQVKKNNAEEYVAKLKTKGYTDAEVYIHNRIVRVVYGNYATEAEAYQQLNKIAANEDFSDAWVYKKPDASMQQQEPSRNNPEA